MNWRMRAAGHRISADCRYEIERGPIGWELRHGSALVLIAARLADAKWYAQAHADGRSTTIADAISDGLVGTQSDLDTYEREVKR